MQKPDATQTGQFQPVGSHLPPGFRPVDKFLQELDAQMFQRMGIHWFLMRERTRRRINNRIKRRLWLSYPLHLVCVLRPASHWWRPTDRADRQRCLLCGRQKRILA